jgi:hypothetical protein
MFLLLGSFLVNQIHSNWRRKDGEIIKEKIEEEK